MNIAFSCIVFLCVCVCLYCIYVYRCNEGIALKGNQMLRSDSQKGMEDVLLNEEKLSAVITASGFGKKARDIWDGGILLRRDDL